jgi:hypothetical protein
MNGTIKLFQINEDDLRELEDSLPFLIDELDHHLLPSHKVRARRLQQVLSRVRWKYGPSQESHIVDDDPPPLEGVP